MSRGSAAPRAVRTDHPTRTRLLRAAVGLFAEQGYEATSVRQLCDRAGANVAAVGYHFGSKSGLYDAAIDFARAESNERNTWVALDTDRDFWSDAPPEDRLRRFVAMMLDHALDEEGGASDLSRIMIHEMLDPTPAFERQIEISIERVFGALRDICDELAGGGEGQGDPDTAARRALLISAQCLYPALVARTMPRMHEGVRFDTAGRAALASLIADSVLASIACPPE